ncbi:unnamed protein product [Urochloa decumbens]|uniref:Uncharacterized protein n=1 Tax=Urochloa decumbens TaxID=240449 RepID=A0ABC9C2Z9_9POAL
MVSRAVAAAVHLACAFGAVLYWAAHLAGHIQQALASKETTTLPSGDSHAHAGAATVPLLLASTTYFLAVTRVYLELAVAANPGLIAAQRLAAATAKAAAVTPLLVVSVAAAVLSHHEA